MASRLSKVYGSAGSVRPGKEMAIGRSRYAPPYVSTKGHSVLKQRSYAMPTRTPPTSNVSRASSVAYDTRAEEYLLSDRVNNVNYLSNSLLDEGYDTAKRSRGRDQQLLKEATNAIVSSESYATPQTSVASRRVARGGSQAPRAASVPPRPLRSEVDSSQVATETSTTAATVSQAPPSPRAKRPIIVLPAPAAVAGRGDRATSVPPVVVFREDKRQKAQVVPVSAREEWRNRAKARSVPPPPVAAPVRRRPYRAPEKPVVPVQAAVREPLPTAGLRAHKVPRRFLTRSGMRTGFSSLHGYYADEPRDRNRQADTEGFRKSVTRARVLGSPVTKSSALPPYYVPPKPKPAPITESLSEFPKVYVPTKGPKPSNRSKAAIIASKLEPDPLKRRRPRSEYAANKYRELRKESQESASGGSSQSGPYGSSMVEAPRIKSAMKKKSRFLGKGTTTVATFKFPGPYDTDIQLKAPKKGSVRFDLKESEDDRSGGGADEYLDTSGVEASSRPVSDLRRRIRRTLNKSRLS